MRLDHGGRRRAGWDGVCCALVVLGGCGREAPNRTPDAPRVVAPDEVHLLASPEALARVLDLEVTGDGEVWILNSVQPFFVAVGADGRVSRSFGDAGEGPEEYGFPVGLVLGPGAGDVWVYDVPRHALRRVAPEPGPDLNLPSDVLAPPSLVSFQGAGFRPASPWMSPAANGIRVARGRPAAPPWTGLRLWHADVQLVRSDGNSPVVEPGVAIADLLGDPASRWPAATVFLPYPLWSFCGDGGLALYDPLRNSLRRFGPHGEEGDPIPLPDERRVALEFEAFYGMFDRQYQEEVPESQRVDSTRMREMFRTQFPQLTASSADVFPEYADLRCADDGVLWLQRFDTKSPGLGRGPEWWRFDADGSRTLVRFPDGFTALRFRGHRAWGANVDSLGFPSVGWVDVGR